ncbi:MAG: hypothetical protein M3P06_07830 [Acidobacteriota bacterium]|nr:hypothetical protein [Acidobacteriota bacterium]
MRARTALLLAAALLIAVSAFAGDSLRLDRPDRSPFDRESRVLTVPYYLDGVLFPANHPLPSQSVSIVLGKSDGTGRAVNVFTSKDVAKEFMRQQMEARADNARTPGISANADCPWTPDYSWFNKNVGCGGSHTLYLYHPNSYDDLDFGGWNNTISCVKAACNGYFTVIYACRDFMTSTGYDCDDADYLFIYPGEIITDLNYYGMNNRTSSIQFQ